MYEPKVNDYVLWNKPNFPIEGWVYFKDHEHITIEIGVNDKNKEQLVHGTHHRKDHILVVCPVWCWNELNYVKKRSFKEENSMESLGKINR